MRLRGIHVPLWRERARFLLLGLTGVFGFSALLYVGLRLIPAALAGGISGLQPVFILLMDVLVNQRQPGGRAWFGVGISVLGVLLLTGAGLALGRLNLLGVAAILFTSVLWGVYTALSRRYRLDPLVATAGGAVYGAVPSLVCGVAALPGSHIHLTLAGILAIAYVSTAASVGAYLLWNHGVYHAGAARAARFINLLPIFAVGFSMAILGEHITTLEAFGAAVVVVGAWLAGSTRSVPQVTDRHVL